MPDDLNVLWADAALEGFAFDYDHVEIRIRESTGQRVTVQADGQIGVDVCGFWDETVIESGTLVEEHPFANECRRALVERLGSDLPESGSPRRNRGTFSTLVISLIDGTLMLCVAADFTTERQP